MLFLIEYEKDCFINGEEVNWIGIKNGSISFTIKGDSESAFVVSKEYQRAFINNLQAINQNGGIEARYAELNSEDT